MANPNQNFTERRKQYRLPYNEKIVFTDGKRNFTSYASNVSKGGLFVLSIEPYAIETQGHISFFLPQQELSFCVKAKVVHIVFDKQRCEIENGMGFQFSEMTEAQKSILNLYILNQQAAYQELRKVLQAERPDPTEIQKCLLKLPTLKHHDDLLALRYRVNRICTIFDPSPLEQELHQNNLSA